MSNLLVIFGATGQQGGSIVDYVLADPALSKTYTIRAVTREPTKPAGQALQQKGVEVVAGDVSDRASMDAALAGAHTVFATTVSIYTAAGKDEEVAQGKALADAAVAAGAQYLIWSSSTNVTELSGGKITAVGIFDSKAIVEDYIRTLPIQSAFYTPASFMQNLLTHSRPRALGDGTYGLANIFDPDFAIPWIDVAADSGAFVGAILAEPDNYAGKVLAATSGLYTYAQIAATISKVTGRTVGYKQLPDNVFKSFLPAPTAEIVMGMTTWFRDFGYYGPETTEKAEWSMKQARGKLTSLEEFLAANPLKLE